MKTIYTLILVFVLSTLTFAQQIQWNSFNDGLEAASKGNKKVLMNVYADWNRWSKRMDKDVYSQPDIIAYLGKYFSVVKLDAESNKEVTYNDETLTEMALASEKLGIDGYPTTVFFTPTGEVITSVPGYIPPEKFILILKYIADDSYKTMEWDEYEAKHKND